VQPSISPIIRFIFLLLVFSLVIGGLSWVNYRFSVENPGGSDFLVHWVGTRAMLMEGISPYSDIVARRIQTIAYGRPAQPGEHELRVAYPLYSVILFLPFSLISDFTIARTAWMTFLEIALVSFSLLSARLTGWRPARWVMIIFILFSLFWYHGARPLINGNAVIVVALLLAGVFIALKNGSDELAGILLGFSTIKPQIVILVITYVFFWSISVRRWRVVLWTIITIVFISILAMFFIPDWPLQNLWEVLRYPSYNPPGTPGAVFAAWWPATGNKLSWGLTGILVLLLGGEWLASRRKEFHWFLWTACLTLTADQWIGIQTDPGNFIVLLVPLVLIFAMWEKRLRRAGVIAAIGSMLILFAGLWLLFLGTIDYGYQPQQSPVMFFPFPLFLLVGLYWVRWWAMKPARMPLEELRGVESL